jgi:hypothetical protein
MQSQEVILSRFSDQFLMEGQSNDLTVGKMGGRTGVDPEKRTLETWKLAHLRLMCLLKSKRAHIL